MMHSMLQSVTRADSFVVALYGANAVHDMRLDANETAVFARQLEAFDVNLYKVEYPENKALSLIPLNTQIDAGDELYTYRWYDEVGQMKPISNWADDLPRVDVIGYESTQKIFSLGLSYGYSIMDLRRSKRLNYQIDNARAQTARQVSARTLDQILFSGWSDLGITGLANAASVPLVSVGTGNWLSATADQILGDLLKLEASIFNTSKGVEMADTLVLPQTRYAVVASKPLGTPESQTVLEFFLKRALGIRNIEWSYRLETADAAGTGPRAIAYKRDKSKLEGIVPIEWASYPPQARNMGFNINCEMRCGGVAVRYPLSMAYMDGI